VERRLSIDEIAERLALPKGDQRPTVGRVWRCKYGVMAVTTNDTLLRARLQAWMDCLLEQWIHSPGDGA
jgi:hypothetical protein